MGSSKLPNALQLDRAFHRLCMHFAFSIKARIEMSACEAGGALGGKPALIWRDQCMLGT